MTVSTTLTAAMSLCNGVTTSFPVPFQYAAPSDLVVELVSAAGDVTLLVEGADYVRIGDGMAAPSSITTSVAYSNGSRLRRRRDTTRKQQLDLVPNVGAPAEAQERALDRIILAQQEQDATIDDTIERALMVPPGEAASYLPGKAERVGSALVFDDNGEPVTKLLGTFPPGPAGPAGNVAATIEQLRGAPITNRTMIAAYDGTGSTMTWTEGNFAALAASSPQNYVKSNAYPLTTGAWVRQTADSVTFQQKGTRFIRTTQAKAEDIVSLKDFGARENDFSYDNSSALEEALAELAKGSYEAAKGLFMPGGIYRFTRTLTLTIANGPIRIYSDTRATLFPDGPDGMWAMDVDFATGANANFVGLDMENITFSDVLAPFKVKKGLRMQRVVGSKFTRCEWNNLAHAIDAFNDSNLNTFDTCQLRNNILGVRFFDGSGRTGDGIANNNVFVNPQFRYHDGTALDTRGSDGTQVYGGDFEPYNKSPVIVAQNMTMRGTRFERNVDNGTTGILVLNDNDLDVIAHSDGGTQVLPLYDVPGSNNRLRVSGNGAAAAIVRDGAKNNVIEIPYFETLISPGTEIYRCESGEPSNIFKSGGSLQANGASPPVEAFKSELMPSDLTLWTATDCTVAAIAGSAGGYRVTITGPAPALSYTPPAKIYRQINIAVTATCSNAASQPVLNISGGVNPAFGLSNGFPNSHKGRRVLATFHSALYENPTFKIQPVTVQVGTTFEIYNLRSSERYTPQ